MGRDRESRLSRIRQSGTVRSHQPSACTIARRFLPIKAVLFDADGVIQRPAPERQERFRALLGPKEKHLDEFMAELWAAEGPTLAGNEDFAAALSRVLDRWRCEGSLEEALQAWAMLAVETAIVETIARLRLAGTRCYLASNQEAHRARYMSETLGYASTFDGEFYSCHMGVAKPDPAYFRSVLMEIQLSGDNVLFLDDPRGQRGRGARSGPACRGVHGREWTRQPPPHVPLVRHRRSMRSPLPHPACGDAYASPAPPA